jgi:RHH-type proline utilization regulon transcriptional repressor/proline dehydrogenase/delta 1-pyrroline-5-carboxylate dehydrogenase
VLLRLVKGAYWDYETVVNRQKAWPVPVFLKKEETDSNYEDLTRILFENIEYVRPAIASHNIRSISHAVAVADSMKLQSGAFEFQMIFGMAEPVRSALKNMNFRVRSYTPVGELIPGMAYLIRRLLENTSNQSFLRKSFSDQVGLDELLKPPQPVSEGADAPILAHGFSNEPLTDFSKAENRRNMERALEQVRKDFTKRYPLSIGGRDVRTDYNIVSVNPAKPEELVGLVSCASIEQAENAIDAARLPWSQWRKAPVEKRAEYMFQAAEEIRKRRFELMALEVYEVGKTWSEADGDLSEAIDHLEYYAKEMVRLGRLDLPGHYPGEDNEYYYEGRGVAALISPGNFPLAIPAGMVSAALVTGTCVIFKPSSLAPVLGWRLVDIFRSAGLCPQRASG